MASMWYSRILAFDVETTGLTDDARIIEFGVSLWEDGMRVVNYGWLINPGEINLSDPNVAKAFEANQIDPTLLRTQPTFADTFSEIKNSLLQSETRAGHNVRFDSKMLRLAFQRSVKAGTLRMVDAAPSGTHITLDTLALDLHLNPEAKGRSLEAVAARWGVGEWKKHRAAGDADAAAQILLAMSGKLPTDVVELMALQKAAQAKWDDIIAKRERERK